MQEVDKDQLEALRNRVEEDYRRAEEDYRRAEETHRRAEENYRLDLAAIEHLQRRFFGAVNGISATEFPSGNGLSSKPPAPPLPPASIQPPQPISAARASEEWEIFKSMHR